jgi:hypothetical protein
MKEALRKELGGIGAQIEEEGRLERTANVG